MDLSGFHSIRIATCDLNGQLRGKRLPVQAAAKLEKGTARMPYSAVNVDLWGHDIDGSPLVFDSGDQDCTLRPTGRGPLPMPWLATPSALVPVGMYHEDGTPFDADPRQALIRVLDRYAARGWHVIAATELEFTLIDDSGPAARAPHEPISGRPSNGGEVLSLRYLDQFDGFLSDLYAAADAMGLPADAATSEAGVAQFEINLTHGDALRAADDTLLFKEMVKGIARRHGFAASFMAKPYADDAGNGLHLHFSVLDDAGRNIFDDGSATGSDLLRQAVAGCLAAMPDSTLIFAPHGNSYDRFVPGAHAPTAAMWGYENRTVALRIPGGPAAARRIEHRVAGGDTNPYLMFAAILGAALIGIEDAMTPPAPITGSAYATTGAPELAADWGTAVDRLAESPIMARIFPSVLIDCLVRLKRQEIREFAQIPKDARWRDWLERV
ncbi:MAG: glutamine synthetase family protein [Marinibacterium sp.]|nr:glutamine synthetase family protein [Marinibacterium sp.]